jgi:hypothetical protein
MYTTAYLPPIFDYQRIATNRKRYINVSIFLEERLSILVWSAYCLISFWKFSIPAIAGDGPCSCFVDHGNSEILLVLFVDASAELLALRPRSNSANARRLIEENKI